MPCRPFLIILLVGFVCAHAPRGAAHAGELAFKEIELKSKLGVGYAVKLADVNDDGRRDIVVVDQKRLLWLESPNWNEHVLVQDQTKPDNVCAAAYDINGDGQLDFAVGADWKPFDTAAGGTLQWIRRGETPADPWRVFPIAEEPTLHRVEWADLNGNGRAELLVVPLMGKNSTKPEFADQPLRVLAFTIPAKPETEAWPVEVLCHDVHVCHNFQAVDLNGDKQLEILLASAEGVSLLQRSAAGKWNRTLIGAGNQAGKMPQRGASEIKLGRGAKNAPFIATIEPWHGHEVVVYSPPTEGDITSSLWTRLVIDAELKWGHAVTCANLDDDPDDELVIGVRDNLDSKHSCGVRVYDFQEGQWKSQRLDPGGVAVEDLTVGDLNGDRRAEIIAVGRATKNVKIYWNETK